MSVYIDKILFTDDYTGLPSGNGSDTGTSYLMGCVGDLIYATINFRVSWSALNITATFSTADNSITLNYCQTFLSVSGTTVTDNSFTGLGFKAGDSIVITGAGGNNGTYTISSITDARIVVGTNIPSEGVFANVNIYGTTSVNTFDFYYNLTSPNKVTNNLFLKGVGNSGNGTLDFNSQTDINSIQKFTGFEPMYGTFNLNPNASSKAWWNDEIDEVDSIPVVTDNGVDDNYNHHYTIVFPFLITPFFLANQLALLQSSLSDINILTPDYFTNQCLQFVCKIDARFNVASPIVDHSSALTTSFENGNTAWFNSFFPSGVNQAGTLLLNPQYDLISCTYTDNSNNPLTSIDVNNPTKVKLKISGGTSWDAAPYVLNFMWLPSSLIGLINNANFRQLFLHDRCKTTVGHASVNGDQYGTSIQAIKGVTSTIYNYGLDLEVDFTIDLGSLSKSVLNNDSQRNYLIWITPQDASIETLDKANRNAVIGDVNKAFVNTDDSSLMTIVTDGTTDVHFFNYPNTGTNPLTDWKNWSGEYGLAKCQFTLADGTILNDFSVIVEAQVYDGNGKTVATFPLESWTKQTNSFFDGTDNQIQINETRDFNLPAGDLRNTRSLTMQDIYYPVYTMIYGFQIGYKFWQNLPNFSEQYLKYPVNYWSVFTQTFAGNNSGYPAIADGFTSKIKFKIVWNVLDIATNIVTEFISYSDISCYDEGSNIGTNACVITTADLLGNNLNGLIATNKPIYVVATFTGNNLVVPMGYTAVGELVLYYNDGLNIVYDRVMSDDVALETNKSLWTMIPSIHVTDSTITVMASLDLTADPLKLRSAGIYAKIIFKKN